MKTSTQLNIESPMRHAGRTGVKEYQPVLAGEPLQLECGDPEHSLNNLNTLLDIGLKTVWVETMPGGAYIVFDTGETYLATGFGIEKGSLRTRCFAEFLAASCGSDTDSWIAVLLSAHGSDYFGGIPLHTPCFEADE